MAASEHFSPAEISAVTGAPLKAVYKLIGERLPPSGLVHHDQRQMLTRWGAVCFVIDREMPKDVPLSVRRHLYAEIVAHQTSRPAQVDRGILTYVVDVKSVANRVDHDVARYRRAMRLIVEDEAIQAGAAVFRGTRILVHQIADLLSQGAEEAELMRDYPRLTPAMIAAAPIYAKAFPRRGRPRKPAWRNRDKAATTRNP